MNFDRIRELVWEQTFQSSKLSSVLVMLEEVGKFISGRTPKSDELVSIGDIPYFKVGDMNTEGNEKVLRVTSLFLKEKAGKTFPAGAIVYPKNGGAVFTNKRRILATESVIDLNTGGFVCGERLNQAYTYMFFCGLDFRKISKGTALPTIDQKKLHQTKIPVPSLEEQSRIVTRLGEAFAEIDRAEKAYEELQTLAGVLRGQILQKAIQGKLVPQMAEEGVVEQIGTAPEEVPFEIPMSWKWVQLNGICTLKSGVDMPPSVLVNEPVVDSIPYITGGSQIGQSGELLITRWTSKATNISESGDVLLICKGSGLGRTALNTYGEVHIARQIMAVRQTEYSTPQYLDLLLKWHHESLRRVAKGVIPGISRSDLLSLWVPIPPVREQVRIVEKVRELMQHVDALSA